MQSIQDWISSLAAHYAFASKEKDVETGLSYFGARYYSSELSIWLSVDPMSWNYPSTSPYAYCRNNPIVLMDPSGKFDTRSEARQYRKEHHTGGRIANNNSMDNFSGKYSIVNKETGCSYTKPQYDYSQSKGEMIGLMEEGVVRSPLIRDSRTGRERFEDFEMKATRKGGAVGQGFVTAIPIGSEVNDINTLTNGENLFGDKASEADKVWAVLDLATLGTGHLVKKIRKTGTKAYRRIDDAIDNLNLGLAARSGLSTTAKRSKNEKSK